MTLSTTSSSIPLFRNFQKKSYEIHMFKYNCRINYQAYGAILKKVIDDILNLVKNRLKIKHSRKDYCEFL